MNGFSALFRLALADLHEHWGHWAWTFFVAAVGAACIGATFTVQTTMLDWVATQLPAERAALTEFVQGLMGQVVTYVSFAAVTVITATANLTVTAGAREYALWKVLGVQAWQVLGVLVAELLALGTLAGAAGALFGPLLGRAYLGAWTDFPDKGDNIIPQLVLVTDPATLPAAVGIAAAFTVVGGIAAAWKTARLPEMQALRDSEAPAVGVGWPSGLAAAFLLLAALVALGLARFVPDAPDANLLGWAAVFFLIVAALTVSPLTLRPLLFAITAPIPRRATAAFLAREGCRYRSGQSMATILPFAVVLSLMGSVYGLEAGVGGDLTGVASLFALVFVVAGAGGIANIALVGAERRRDLALLEAAGAGGIANIALVGAERRRDLALLEAAGAGRSTLRVLPLLEGGKYALT